MNIKRVNNKDNDGCLDAQKQGSFNYEEPINRDEASLGAFWLKDESFEELKTSLKQAELIAEGLTSRD